MQSKQNITLPKKEKKILQDITRKGKASAVVIKRAWILLKSDLGWEREQIAKHVELSEKTITRRLNRYEQEGMEKALYDDPRPGQPKKLDNEAEAFLVATACSGAPEGRDHWTLEMLQKRLIQKKKVTSITTVTIWKYLKNRGIKPWLEKNVVHS